MKQTLRIYIPDMPIHPCEKLAIFKHIFHSQAKCTNKQSLPLTFSLTSYLKKEIQISSWGNSDDQARHHGNQCLCMALEMLPGEAVALLDQ